MMPVIDFGGSGEFCRCTGESSLVGSTFKRR